MVERARTKRAGADEIGLVEARCLSNERPLVPDSWVVHTNEAMGISIATPPTWHVSWGYRDSFMKLATYELGDDNFCAPNGALTMLQGNNAFFWLFESDDPSAFDFGAQPPELKLDDRTLATYETMGCHDMYRVTFSSLDRHFVTYVGLASDATASLRERTAQSLNTFKALTP